jgi:hypothetical protein
VTLHCQSNGNYEKLQCDEGLCWCVDPADGKVTTGKQLVDVVVVVGRGSVDVVVVHSVFAIIVRAAVVLVWCCCS